MGPVHGGLGESKGGSGDAFGGRATENEDWRSISSQLRRVDQVALGLLVIVM